jgi:cytohesin
MEAVSQIDLDAPPEGVDRVEVVRLLLSAGADPNARDNQGNTALILGANREKFVLSLVNAGADVNARNHKGATALSSTFNEGAKRILLQHGATTQQDTDSKK